MIVGYVAAGRVHASLDDMCDAFDCGDISQVEFIAGCNLYNVLTAYHGGPPFFYVFTGDPLSGTTASICVSNQTIVLVGSIPNQRTCAAFLRTILKVAADGGLLFDIRPEDEEVPRLIALRKSIEAGVACENHLAPSDFSSGGSVTYSRPSTEKMEWWKRHVNQARKTGTPIPDRALVDMRTYLQTLRKPKNVYLRTIPVRVGSKDVGNGVGNIIQALRLAATADTMASGARFKRESLVVDPKFKGIAHCTIHYQEPFGVYASTPESSKNDPDHPAHMNFRYMAVFTEFGKLIITGSLTDCEIRAAARQMYSILQPYLRSPIPLPRRINPVFIDDQDVFAMMVFEPENTDYPFLKSPMAKLMLSVRNMFFIPVEYPEAVFKACHPTSFCLVRPDKAGEG